MGKETDSFKGDSMRVRSKDRPFLLTGISMSDVKKFDEGKSDRVVKIKPPKRNVKKSSIFL